MKIFDILGDEETVTAERLASLLGMEKLLASEFFHPKFSHTRTVQLPVMRTPLTEWQVRMMRILISIGIFNEVGEEEYHHNRRSIALKRPAFCTFASGL